MKQASPLLDKDFLKKLDEFPHKELFARVTALTWAELPIEQIEGRITIGSIAVDGTSAVRRTCNLTMVAEELNINNFHWGLTHKMLLEVGVKNTIDTRYPDIIWFKEGIFVITTFNTTFSVTNYNIQISGKDKMCMLNGDIGGNLSATTDFGTIDIYDTRYSVAKVDNESGYQAHKYYIYDPTKVTFDNATMKWSDGYVLSDDPYDSSITYYNQEQNYKNLKLPIREILREAIHTYASEPYHKIIINDLEDYALELLEYRNEDAPLYVVFEEGTQESRGVFYDSNVEVCIATTGRKVKLSEIPVYDSFVEDFNEDATKVYFEANPSRICTIVKINFGETAGFHQTDLIYADDLIGNVGESFTSILDKIVNMLGEFEYFYNLDGYFVFQRQKVYTDTRWNPLVEKPQGQDEVYINDAAYTSPDAYSLTNNLMITAFTGSPAFNNLKNDYSIHGKRISTFGNEIPIHYRFAIDYKPTRYQAFPVSAEQSRYLTTNFPESFPIDEEHVSDLARTKYQRPLKTYVTDDYEIDPENDINWVKVDWRELIYQMAHDYHMFHEWDDFLYQVELYNPTFVGGITSYEQYYTDVLSFWRELYVPDLSLRRENNPYVKYASDGGNYIETIEYTRDETGTIVNDGTYKTTVQNWVDYNEKSYDFECDYFLPTSLLESKAQTTIGIENTMIYLQADPNNQHILKWYLETELPELQYVTLSYEIHRLNNLADKTSVGTRITTQPLKCNYSLINNNTIQYGTISTNETTKNHELEQYYFKWPKNDNTAFYYWEDTADIYKDYLIDGNYDNLQTKYNTIYYKIRALYTNAEGKTLYSKWSNIVGVTICSRYTIGRPNIPSTLIERFISRTENYPHNATDQLKTTDYTTYLSHFNDKYAYWNKQIYYDPSQINFWIDFLDTTGELGQYSVPLIGDRPKAINDDQVTSIYYKETPNVIYVLPNDNLDMDNLNPGYKYVRVPQSFASSFIMSAQGKSARERLNELLYQFSYCIENATITCIPIYYLDVNTRVFVFDENSHINGEYIVQKLTIPLTYNGLMSITAHKAVERMY